MHKNTILAFVSSSVLFMPAVLFAQGLVPCNGPDCNFSSFVTLINNAITLFLYLAISLAGVTFMIAGAKILLNPGNAGKRSEALGMFKKTIIGMVIVLVAWLVIHTIVGLLVNKNIGALRFLGN
jgi:hypothetical protein